MRCIKIVSGKAKLVLTGREQQTIIAELRLLSQRRIRDRVSPYRRKLHPARQSPRHVAAATDALAFRVVCRGAREMRDRVLSAHLELGLCDRAGGALSRRSPLPVAGQGPTV